VTIASADRWLQKYAAFFDADADAVTGVSIEVFWADTTLETFGRGPSGWF
jgi:hypothetical protein